MMKLAEGYVPEVIVPELKQIPLKVKAPSSLLRAADYRLIRLVFQQLNFAEWPQFCDHSVTSADVRLSVGTNRRSRQSRTD
jgi:hypothetical protein